MANGLLNIQSNSDLLDAEKAKHDAENRQPEIYESQLSSHIQKAWEVNRWAKEEIEDEMLACLRQRNGEYDDSTLASIRAQGGSEIYMMITATKVRAAVSWLRDILLPAGDKAWGLSPTPIPDLPPFFLTAIAQRVRDTMAPDETQNQSETRAIKMRDEMLKAAKEIASDASGRMEQKIEDQLVEGGWDDALGEFIEDFATFQSAIFKAPTIKRKKNLAWSKDFTPEVSDKIYLKYERVSPFDIYPSPDATTPEDGELIERIRFERKTLYNFIGLPGYNEEAIRAVLSEYGQGGLKEWLWRDYERAKLENKDRFWMRQDQKTIDGLHYWGSSQGLALLEWGIDPEEIDDPLAEYEIDAIKVGRHVIRAVVNKDPLQGRPYHKASYQIIPGAFWGIAMPKLMRDHQRMCNATARALANNLGIASGPMVEVETDRLADGEVVEQLYPWKIFQTKADKTGRGREAIRFHQPRSNAQELLAVYEQFERRADDATSIPRYAHGNEKVGGAGSTAAGLSMLMNNASKGIKLATSTIDKGVIKPTITKTFIHNMLYDPDISIKGDVSVIARGANALLIKEQTQMRRAEFLNATNNDLDSSLMGPEGRLALLREQASSLDMDVDKIVPSLDAFKEKQEMAAQQEAPPDPKIIELQQKGELEQAKMQMSHEHFMTEMEVKQQMEQEKVRAEIHKVDQKLRAEYDMKQRTLEEESRQKELDRDIEREKDADDREAETSRIREEVRLAREAKDIEKAPEPKQAMPAPITLIIDNKSGEIKKTIEINRGADKLVSSAEVTEKQVEK